MPFHTNMEKFESLNKKWFEKLLYKSVFIGIQTNPSTNGKAKMQVHCLDWCNYKIPIRIESNPFGIVSLTRNCFFFYEFLRQNKENAQIDRQNMKTVNKSVNANCSLIYLSLTWISFPFKSICLVGWFDRIKSQFFVDHWHDRTFDLFFHILFDILGIFFCYGVKMEPLKINQQVLTWLCIFPANEATSKRKKLAYIGLALTTVVSMSIITLGSMVFFVKYVLTDLESALYALFQIFDCGGFLYACLVFYLSRHRIPSIFVNLAEIYRSSKNQRGF